MLKWIQNKRGKYIPCKNRLVSFIPNSFSTTFFIDVSGNMIRGIERTDGVLCGYEVDFSR